MPTRFLKNFIEKEQAAVLFLLLATLTALVWANAPWRESYEAFWETKLYAPGGGQGYGMSLRHIVNDIFMSLFFLIVGCELKRERLEGELSSLPQVKLSLIAALGGMVVPALVYVFIGKTITSSSLAQDFIMRGWAIPTATDIAFALGVFGFLGTRLPSSLKTFLLALAIIDDLGSVILIGLFYSSGLHYEALALSGVLLVLLYALNRRGIAAFVPYAFIGGLLWVSVYLSGVHPTMAGLFLAAFLPLRSREEKTESASSRSLLRDVEEKIHPWVSFLILPVFALANAGVSLTGLTFDMVSSPLFLGIALGLFLGKQLGVFALTWLCVRLGLATRPRGANWGQIYGVSVLCGLGFTMSLFIGLLAFQDSAAMVETRFGILVGSLLSAGVGYFVLRFFSPLRKT